MDRMRGGGWVYGSCKTPHAINMFCADVQCDGRNKNTRSPVYLQSVIHY